jgi:hypothetical protein
MLLRASSELEGGATPDLRGVTDAASSSGVPAGDLLTAFADATIDGDPEAIARAREAVVAELGTDATVDAAGVIGNFQRMVRIADGTGIPLDAPVKLLSAGMRAELGIDSFASAQNTPPLGAFGRLASRALQPLVRVAMKRFAGS